MGIVHATLPHLSIDDEEIGRYAGLLDSLGIGLEVFGADGSPLSHNAAARTLYGNEAHAWQDNGGRPLSFSDSPVSEVLRTSLPALERSLQLVCDHRPAIAVRVSALPVFSADGALRRVLLVLGSPADAQQSSIHDRSSGIFNQSHALFLLDNEIHRARRYGTPFTLALIGIDQLRPALQSAANGATDRQVARVARLIGKSLREIDIAGRFGSAGVLVILPNVALKDAMVGLERLRQLVETQEGGADTAKLTISGGVSEYSGENAAPLIEQCASLLEQARQSGGNRFCVDLGPI